jgi:hypothetical protein
MITTYYQTGDKKNEYVDNMTIPVVRLVRCIVYTLYY